VLPAPEGLFPDAAQAFLIERTVHHPHDEERLAPAVAALAITRRSPERGGTPEVIGRAAGQNLGAQPQPSSQHRITRPGASKRKVSANQTRQPQQPREASASAEATSTSAEK